MGWDPWQCWVVLETDYCSMIYCNAWKAWDISYLLVLLYDYCICLFCSTTLLRRSPKWQCLPIMHLFISFRAFMFGYSNTAHCFLCCDASHLALPAYLHARRHDLLMMHPIWHYPCIQVHGGIISVAWCIPFGMLMHSFWHYLCIQIHGGISSIFCYCDTKHCQVFT